MCEPLPRERSNFAPLLFNHLWNSALFIYQEYTKMFTVSSHLR
jgi:hypothetical protein